MTARTSAEPIFCRRLYGYPSKAGFSFSCDASAFCCSLIQPIAALSRCRPGTKRFSTTKGVSLPKVGVGLQMTPGPPAQPSPVAFRRRSRLLLLHGLHGRVGVVVFDFWCQLGAKLSRIRPCTAVLEDRKSPLSIWVSCAGVLVCEFSATTGHRMIRPA